MDNLLSNIKKVHLVGIGGVGMTGLAFILRERGFIVSGSDIKESYNLNVLRKESFRVFSGHSRSNVEDVDLVCFSSAVKEGNVEVLEAKNKGIMVIRRGELLALLSKGIRTIAVAGSHGKTTTSALLAFVLTELGYNPNVFIGAFSLNFNKYAWTGKDLFVIEADESDGSFLVYEPWISIITNIDSEHLDFYKNLDNLKNSFYELAHKTKNITIGCGDDRNTRDVLRKVSSLSYGFSPENYICAENVKSDGNFTVFDLNLGRERFDGISIPLLGNHNVLNTMAVLSLCWHLGLNIEKVSPILRRFKGTRRRFQVKGQIGGTKFIDDYAHHPQEIKAVIKAAGALPKERLVVIFQPHRYSRVKLLCREFARCFSGCDYLVVTDIYSAGEDGLEGINGYFIYNEIKKHFSNNLVYVPRDRLAKEVSCILRDNDVVIGLGAGDINILIDKVMDEYMLISKDLVVKNGN